MQIRNQARINPINKNNNPSRDNLKRSKNSRSSSVANIKKKKDSDSDKKSFKLPRIGNTILKQTPTEINTNRSSSSINILHYASNYNQDLESVNFNKFNDDLKKAYEHFHSKRKYSNPSNLRKKNNYPYRSSKDLTNREFNLISEIYLNEKDYNYFVCGFIGMSDRNFKNYNLQKLLFFSVSPISIYVDLLSLKYIPNETIIRLADLNTRIKELKDKSDIILNIPKTLLKKSQIFPGNMHCLYITVIRYYTSVKDRFENGVHIISIYKNIENKKLNLFQKYPHLNVCLYEAISILPLFWGECTRIVTLTDTDKNKYQVGNIVCWLYFGSSFKGDIALDSDDKSVFKIYSQTGRSIKEFSINKNEDEVLFLPFCQFLVCKIEVIESINYYYLQEIELGAGIKNVLWIYHKIHSQDNKAKKKIEESFTKSSRIRFILKNSTESALCFLKSFWGLRKLKDINNFRIIIKIDKLIKQIGFPDCAEFLSQVISLGFNCKKMIFTNDTHSALETLEKYRINDCEIKVTKSGTDALNFISFI